MTTTATRPRRQASDPWSPRSRTLNARRLLVAGLVGGHAAGICVVGVMLALRGPRAAATAAVAAVVVIAFYTIGQGVQVVFAEASPTLTLVASLTSYVIRVAVLGLLLAAAMRMPGLDRTLDPGALFAGAIVTLLGWLAVELVAYSRLRFPIYDTEYRPPAGEESRHDDV